MVYSIGSVYPPGCDLRVVRSIGHPDPGDPTGTNRGRLDRDQINGRSTLPAGALALSLVLLRQ